MKLGLDVEGLSFRDVYRRLQGVELAVLTMFCSGFSGRLANAS